MQDLFVRVRGALAEHYDIRRLIGTGGMAAVFEAWDPLLAYSVAIKVLKPALATGVPRERFRREVAVASKLHHPHIVPILTSGEVAGVVYCVMPFVSGESLRHRLIRDQTVPLAESIHIAAEIASALHYAHGQGIVHRDIKPENILLSEGHALVADFGIARVMLDDGSNLTITGTAIGTPNYMSPEQATGNKVDGRTDIYSLGCVLHEMIAGTQPFAHLPTPYARTPQERATPVSRHSSQRVPQIVDELVVRTLEWKADDRPGTAAELHDALSSAQETTGLPPATPTGRRSIRGWAALGAAAMGVLAAGLLVSRFVGPPAYAPAQVSVELASFNGPARHRALAGTFSDDLIRALGQSVGIGVMTDTATAPGKHTPDYVLSWTMQVDTSNGTLDARISAELRPPGSTEALWTLPATDVPMTLEDLSQASTALARDVAVAIRAKDHPKR